MKLIIKSKEEDYFRKMLELLSPIPPFKTLSGREKDVLSQLLYYNYKVLYLTKEERNAYIFSKASKEKMRKTINISKPSFDNQMAALRKKGFITYTSVDSKFEMKKLDDELTFVFKIAE